MALPKLTSEQRSAALEKAAVARRERAAFKKEIKAGALKLSEALEKADGNPVLAKLRVTALLMSLPGVGQAKCSAIMEKVGISESRRVAGLGPHQRAALLELFG